MPQWFNELRVLFRPSVPCMHTWQILHRLLDQVCDTGSMAAALRPLLGKARQIIVEVFPLPSLLGFWPYRCRLRPAVTPKLQARSDLLHLYERPLRMLPALFRVVPLTTQLVEHHFCFYNGGGSATSRLDRWAGTDTTMRIDCSWVIDLCGFTQ